MMNDPGLRKSTSSRTPNLDTPYGKNVGGPSWQRTRPRGVRVRRPFASPNIPPIHRPTVKERTRRHHAVLLEHHSILHHGGGRSSSSASRVFGGSCASSKYFVTTSRASLALVILR